MSGWADCTFAHNVDEMNIGGHIIDNLIWNNRKKCDDMKPVYAALMADKYPDKLRHISRGGVVGRGRKIQCVLPLDDSRFSERLLGREEEAYQGRSQNPLHFLPWCRVRIYLKGVHRIQRTAPTVLLLRCESGNSCREGAEGPICAKRRRP
jgi:hypothetical protein